MAVVYIGAVKGDHIEHLTLNTLAYSLDTQALWKGNQHTIISSFSLAIYHACTQRKIGPIQSHNMVQYNMIMHTVQ